ncbi:hypothetical protein CALCODRAFT_34192 [Calocera cornea HHB12733]|uniref:Uncharacterized protein n=1 Tax=Calocera cornea HHB12733 TaxID=1353952 RepID=A0A165E1A9_9BASI|nr:hypothetical protein CALCODRAFT_34192 [Calocera cornea HHB12733]
MMAKEKAADAEAAGTVMRVSILVLCMLGCMLLSVHQCITIISSERYKYIIGSLRIVRDELSAGRALFRTVMASCFTQRLRRNGKKLLRESRTRAAPVEEGQLESRADREGPNRRGSCCLHQRLIITLLRPNMVTKKSPLLSSAKFYL